MAMEAAPWREAIAAAAELDVVDDDPPMHADADDELALRLSAALVALWKRRAEDPAGHVFLPPPPPEA